MTRRAIVLMLLGVSGWFAAAAHCLAAPLEVEFVDASRPTACAEEDNVYVKLVGAPVASFRITAEHPPYIAEVRTDSTAPDFTDCDMSSDPSFAFTPRSTVLHEDASIRLVGHVFATNWRPESVEFRVGERIERGLHLVQLIRRLPARDVEMLVVYPADGYWRPKPLPPGSLPDTAYGSSFLVGPVEEDGRPFVAIRSLTFEPETLTFRLVFRDGSRGVLSVAEASAERLALSIALDPPVVPGRPFAALRSMFIATAQADVALARWEGGVRGPGQGPVIGFGSAGARSARFGRVEPSRHNLSAPDLVFDAFSSAGQAVVPR